MFCPCCVRIVAIRMNQGKSFWVDLCSKCRARFLAAGGVKTLARKKGSRKQS